MMEYYLQSYTTRLLDETDIFPNDLIKNVIIMQMKLIIHHLR